MHLLLPCPSPRPGSYAYPQGLPWAVSHPSALLGNIIARRRMAIIRVAHFAGRGALLEQPRLSKIWWMRSWKQPEALEGVRETWMASCAWVVSEEGYLFKKEFRF